MRLLYIHHRPESGGAPTSLCMLLREMRKREDVTIRVLCPQGHVVERFRKEGVDVQTIPISAFYHIPGNKYSGLRWLMFAKEMTFLPFHLLALYRQINQYQPDIIHLNDVVLIPAAILGKLSGRKIVWHVRGVIDYGHFGLRRSFVLYTLWKYGDCVITIDEDERNDLNNMSNIRVVHNSVSQTKFRQHFSCSKAKEILGIGSDCFVVSMISRIQKIKGSYDFIHAAHIVKQHIPNVKFIMAGGAARPSAYFRTWKGRLFEVLGLTEDSERIAKELIHEYKMEKDFILFDFIEEIEKVYLASDVVVFPSHLRGIGRSALEASMLGIPTVATTVNWNDDVIIHRKTGILVAQQDIEAIAKAIMELLNNEELRREYGQNAKQHAKKNFNVQRNAEKVYQIYQCLMEETSR